MDHSGMDMPSMSGGMMKPYLHFTGGDNLFLSAWAPSSKGEIAGACFGLFLLAILERLVAATRVSFNSYWQTRALAIDGMRYPKLSHSSTPAEDANLVFKSQTDDGHNQTSAAEMREAPRSVPILFPKIRNIPPFMASHDIPRGVLFAFQMLLTYLLMLAVMTFQAGYLISIVLGLGIGETLFGRVSRGGEAH